MRTSRALILLGALASAVLPSFGIVVTPTGNATTLANTLLGSGITLVGTPTLTGGNLGNANSSAATFTNGLTTGIGISSGVLLTSGQANLVTNNNDNDSHTGSFGGAGDVSLNSLGAGSTMDATVLTFDFTTNTGDLFFQFAFASEEYTEYVNSQYNDVFGFFVDGTNIALLPSTTTPISINNVNHVTNSSYYNNNDLSFGPPAFAFSYDGFTDVFTVSALGLSSGTHTIKLAIADVGDTSLDSGVFIKAGSFSETQPPGVPDASASLLLLALGCASLMGFRRSLRTA
jgi:hypothetical protein